MDKAREEIQDPGAREPGVPIAYESNQLTLELDYPKVKNPKRVITNNICLFNASF